jgi:hypothetical protein
MDSLDYQKRLSEFDEQIAFHESKAKQVAHERSRFVLAVLSATVDDRDEKEKKKTIA